MKKLSITIGTACLGFAIAVSAISHANKNLANNQVSVAQENSTSLNNNNTISKDEESSNSSQPKVVDKQLLYSMLEAFGEAPVKEDNESSEIASSEEPKIVAVQPAQSNASLSRGGSPSPSANSSQSSSGKIETLDWWSQAQYVFSIGTVATVKDYYTGKTFKIKRTMGTNHADSEALTIEDTNIIKSIWGGFTWDVRPVYIMVNGRALAASMAAMPHAGIDSAPAFAVVNNRSEGYGKGENLDVIKGNGMDGHFDVHFLNSTRHKDGQVDPRHQAAIRIASGR